MARLLVVDDESNLRRVLSALLGADGHAVTEAGSVGEAVAALAASDFDAVLTDQKLPDGEGLQLVSALRERDGAPPVVVITAFATVELAVEAMRLGAFDFITKPFLPEAVRAAVRRAVERAELQRENARLRDEVQRLAAAGQLVGDSAPMRALRDLVARVAPSAATVLVTGETGTGKELVARAVHALSARSRGAFVAINCGAIAESLLESELFGHEKGAFTGASAPRAGVFEAAHGGTLLLDEIGDMPLAAQARLLRVLAEGQVVRLGSTTPRPVDVRVVAATHRDLPTAVREGRFREDLYYRLAVALVAVPPLRARRDDVPLLAQGFLARFGAASGRPNLRFGPEAIAALRAHDWPGNVRELENLSELAGLLAQGDVIDEAAVRAWMVPRPQGGGTPAPDAPGADDESARERWLGTLPERFELRPLLDTLERELLMRALREANGVQAEAARRLGLTRSDVAYRLRKFGLGGPEGATGD
ncbi:MAG: sigma-54-dependent Fis family transcriptional regulator [Candidatus Eisenbacteria bacterium]|uniref:Sigma-54-dependent Fis family transcriptional regulator n=1 Tax=Eiseniibacteriota bacterium TaxID=2212470 RepID=A0A933W772_UNCEI|nr:sigma-54-dependent Fis family transcriptional regulator [Candidatus Eisenbacteria bacterium]